MVFFATALIAFVYFMMVRDFDFLFPGHDYWTSGHGMLISESYIKNEFNTPYLVPVEDCYGPIKCWAPYVGWPPLSWIVLAIYLKITGISILKARMLFCAFSALSAGG